MFAFFFTICYNKHLRKGGVIMKEKTYSLEESYEILDNLTKAFVPFLEHLMEILEVNRVNLVGVGNEVSAGFVNSSIPFTPWLDKLDPFIKAHNNTGLDINIGSYSLLKNNSNFRIYRYLNSNPSGYSSAATFLSFSSSP